MISRIGFLRTLGDVDLRSLSTEDLYWIDQASNRLEILESKEACESSLIEFTRQAWHIIEPANPFIDGWALQAICEHLEAVTYGDINRLLINVPPGFSKSTLTSIMHPAWEWGPCDLPSLRIISTSHSEKLAVRDLMKMRRLIQSQWYTARWPHVMLMRDQNTKKKFENSATGFREAAAFDSLTGSRGDRLIIDDGNSVDSANSDVQRASTNETFRESVPTRLNRPDESAIIIMAQRLHEEDISGQAIAQGGYTHLCLPMEFDKGMMHFANEIGFEDPRIEQGELLFPERFPLSVVERDKAILGSFAVAGQFQQAPVPRGGGIIKREHWLAWDEEESRIHGVPKGAFPPFEYMLASVDTAYTKDNLNDPSALTVWGVWVDHLGRRRLMLCAAWQERYEVNRLVHEIAKTCKRFNGVQTILIEAKASGLSVAQEIRRLYAEAQWAVKTVDPGNKDKVARAYAVQPLFEAGLIYAPDKVWAEMVIAQVSVFPRGKHDDLTDSTCQAVSHLRRIGMLQTVEEQELYVDRAAKGWRPAQALYPVV